MALKAGRVGVAPSEVDDFGHIQGGSDSYTKAQADAKFETQSHAASTYETKSDAAALQPITLSVPIEMLEGTALTVESALQGLNEEITDISEVEPVELTLDDDTNIALQNNKSVRQGSVVCVRTQINIINAKAAGSIIVKATAKHTQYGGAVLIDTNVDNKYNLIAVEQTAGTVSFICKTSIPAGWYALTYTWVEN